MTEMTTWRTLFPHLKDFISFFFAFILTFGFENDQSGIITEDFEITLCNINHVAEHELGLLEWRFLQLTSFVRVPV